MPVSKPRLTSELPPNDDEARANEPTTGRMAGSRGTSSRARRARGSGVVVLHSESPSMPRESAAFLPAGTRRCAARIRPQQSQRELAEYTGWFKHTGPHEALAMFHRL